MGTIILRMMKQGYKQNNPLVKLWLEGIFDPQKAEGLLECGLQEELQKAVAWYRAYRKELLSYGLENAVLERLLPEFNEGLSKEELHANLRAFTERLYYEAFIRKLW